MDQFNEKQFNKILSDLGFNNNQIAIFSYLISNYDATALQIAKYTKLPRTSVYLELGRLQEKGFITAASINRSTKFKAINSKQFSEQIKVDLTRYLNIFTKLNSVEEYLEIKQAIFQEEHEIQIYKNENGIKQLLWNILSANPKEVIGFSPGTLECIVDREFAEDWRLEFQKRNIKNRIILNESVPLNWSNIPDFLNKNVKARTLEKNKIHFDREVLIYNDTLCIISQSTEKNQYGIEIKDKLLVQSYLQLFDFLWKNIAEKIN